MPGCVRGMPMWSEMLNSRMIRIGASKRMIDERENGGEVETRHKGKD